MNRPSLTLEDIARGLERFGDRYHAIDVFADDLVELNELKAGRPVPGLIPMDQDGKRYDVVVGSGKRYRMDIVPDAGVARLSKGAAADASPPRQAGELVAAGAIAGAAIGAATSKKGEGWVGGLLLGLLAGTLLAGTSQSSQGAPRRVFALRFNPDTREWQAYDGGLLRWMKDQLSPQPT